MKKKINGKWCVALKIGQLIKKGDIMDSWVCPFETECAGKKVGENGLPYYRPIKSKSNPKKKKAEKGKSVLAFAYKPNSRIISVRMTKRELILHGVPKDKIIRVRITEVK